MNWPLGSLFLHCRLRHISSKAHVYNRCFKASLLNPPFRSLWRPIALTIFFFQCMDHIFLFLCMSHNCCKLNFANDITAVDVEPPFPSLRYQSCHLLDHLFISELIELVWKSIFVHNVQPPMSLLIFVFSFWSFNLTTYGIGPALV